MRLLTHETAHVVQGYRGELNDVAAAPLGGGIGLGRARQVEAFAEDHERRLTFGGPRRRSRIGAVRLAGEASAVPGIDVLVAKAARLAERRLDRVSPTETVRLGALRVAAAIDPELPGAAEDLAARIVEAAIETARLAPADASDGSRGRRRPARGRPSARTVLLKEDLALRTDLATPKMGRRFDGSVARDSLDPLLQKFLAALDADPDVTSGQPMLERLLLAVDRHKGIGGPGSELEWELIARQSQAKTGQPESRRGRPGEAALGSAVVIRVQAPGGPPSKTLFIPVERLATSDKDLCASCGARMPDDSDARSSPHNVVAGSRAASAIADAIAASGVAVTSADLKHLIGMAQSTSGRLVTHGVFAKQCRPCEERHAGHGLTHRFKNPGFGGDDQFRGCSEADVVAIVELRVNAFLDALFETIAARASTRPLNTPGFREGLKRDLLQAAEL